MDLEEADLLDPHPDIHALFQYYSNIYFEGQLGPCSVEWSSARMTLCGGVCEFAPGGGCRIKLSEPLLKLRPSRDLKEVLLHEMIHAYIMLGGIRDDDPSGHGTAFKGIMRRINSSTVPDSQRPPGGYNITTHHTMHAEVDLYRQHHWRCGRCSNLVKRAMNRPPQEADCRGRLGKGADCRDTHCSYHMHLRHCGGTYDKVKEPEGYGEKKRRGKQAGGSSGQQQPAAGGSRPPPKRPKRQPVSGSQDITKFFGRGRQLGSSVPAAAGQPEGGAGAAAASGAGGAAAGATAADAGRLPSASASPVHPALEAIVRAAGGQEPAAVEPRSSAAPAQQREQQHESRAQAASQASAEPASAEERRRVLAEAALRRLGAQGGGPAQQRQQQAAGGQGEPALPPDRRQAGGPFESSQGQEGRQALLNAQPPAGQQPWGRLPSAARESSGDFEPAQRSGVDEEAEVVDLTCTPPSPRPPQWGAAQGGGAQVQCPVCGRQWAAVELSNQHLNEHVDACLAGCSV